jgi:hypothetical protein
LLFAGLRVEEEDNELGGGGAASEIEEGGDKTGVTLAAIGWVVGRLVALT